MSKRANDSSPAARDGEPSLEDFWAFRTMLTPLLIQILFWIGVFACIGFGVYLIVQATTPEPLDKVRVMHGVAWIMFGPLAVRLVCESIILFFRINETLTEIKNKLK